MASTVINVTDTISPHLRRLILSLTDYRLPLRRCGWYMQRSVAKQFTQRGSPQWKPLSPITIFYRRKWSDSPLLDTGRLRRSYISRNADNAYDLTKLRLDVGSNLGYSRLHQYGGYTTIHEKRWFKSGRNGRPDVMVRMPRTGRVTHLPTSGYKLKYINSYKQILVPARPLMIQPEDARAFRLVFEDYIRHELNRRRP